MMSEKEFGLIFSENLLYYLKEHDMTRSELAKLLDVSDTSVTYWCKGIKIPRMDKVDKMCAIFHVNRSDLMSEREYAQPLPNSEQQRIFTNNLNKFLSLKNKTQRDVAEAINVSPQTFNTWCQGKAIPRMGKIQALADYFGVNKSDLVEDKPQQNDSSSSSQFTPPMKKVINIMQELNEEGQDKLLEYGDDLLASGKYIKSGENELVAE